MNGTDVIGGRKIDQHCSFLDFRHRESAGHRMREATRRPKDCDCRCTEFSGIVRSESQLTGCRSAGGTPDTLRLTLDLKLPRRLTVRVVVAPLPLGTETPSPGLRSAKSSASGG